MCDNTELSRLSLPKLKLALEYEIYRCKELREYRRFHKQTEKEHELDSALWLAKEALQSVDEEEIVTRTILLANLYETWAFPPP